MKKKGWLILVALVVGGGAGLFAYHRHEAALALANVPKPHTALVKRGMLSVHVYATGTVEANLTVQIKCQAGGQITKLPFQIGDVVKQGDLVLEVDPTLERQAKDLATQQLKQSKLDYKSALLNYQVAKLNLTTTRQTDEANLLSDQAQVANDKLNLQRDQTLLKENLAAQQTYDNDNTTLVRDQQTLRLAQVAIEELQTEELQVKLQKNAADLAEISVMNSSSQLNQARTNLSYTKVPAPISGVVSDVNVQPGQIIASALTNVGGGTTIMSLVDLSRIFIDTTVNESDINHIKVGDKVAVTAPGAPGKVFTGRVVLMAPVSQQDQASASGTTTASSSNIVTFQAKIEVLGKDKTLLKPGMTANVNIFADKIPNVLYIPLQAVVISNGQDMVTVVGKNGTMKSKVVNMGKRNDLDWQVVSGLKRGQKVLVHEAESTSMWSPHH